MLQYFVFVCRQTDFSLKSPCDKPRKGVMAWRSAAFFLMRVLNRREGLLEGIALTDNTTQSVL